MRRDDLSEYVYQEFPKVKYHPEKGTVTVQNAEEEKALGKGWYNNPGQFRKPSRVTTGLLNVKPWWEKWEWSFTALAKIFGVIVAGAAVLALVWKVFR